MHTVLAMPMLLAQLSTSSGNAGVDWLYQISNSLTQLTTAQGDALVQIGLVELSTIAFIKLIAMTIEFNLSNMGLSLGYTPLNLGELLRFLLKLSVCYVLVSQWASAGLNHFFAYLAQVITAAFDRDHLNTLTQLIAQLQNNDPTPAALAIPEWICYFLTEGVMALASAILFFINLSAFIFYGVAALFAPIFIPMLMSKRLEGKCYRFMEVLLGLAMIRAVAAGFIFVWSQFMDAFIQKTFNGDYSAGVWLAVFPVVVAVFVAFILNMVFVPKITEMLFGGGAGIAGRLGETGEAIAAYAARKAI